MRRPAAGNLGYVFSEQPQFTACTAQYTFLYTGQEQLFYDSLGPLFLRVNLEGEVTEMNDNPHHSSFSWSRQHHPVTPLLSLLNSSHSHMGHNSLLEMSWLSPIIPGACIFILSLGLTMSSTLHFPYCWCLQHCSGCQIFMLQLGDQAHWFV